MSRASEYRRSPGSWRKLTAGSSAVARIAETVKAYTSEFPNEMRLFVGRHDRAASTSQGFVWNTSVKFVESALQALQPHRGSSGTRRAVVAELAEGEASTPHGHI
jgi:protein involved in temperature-dependent protein secretion